VAASLTDPCHARNSSSGSPKGGAGRAGRAADRGGAGGAGEATGALSGSDVNAWAPSNTGGAPDGFAALYDWSEANAGEGAKGEDGANGEGGANAGAGGA
jgi:hypothetical protein